MTDAPKKRARRTFEEKVADEQKKIDDLKRQGCLRRSREALDAVMLAIVSASSPGLIQGLSSARQSLMDVIYELDPPKDQPKQ